MRSSAAPYTESRLTRSVANERVGFPVVEHCSLFYHLVMNVKAYLTLAPFTVVSAYFKRRFFIGLLSSVQYLSTISTIIFYVFTRKLWFECV